MKNIFKSVFNYMVSQRRGGTTSVLMEVASQKDVNIMFPTMVAGRELKGKVISVHEIANGSPQDGKEPKPILIDNSTMIALMRMASNQEAKLAAMEELFKKFKADCELVMKMPDGFLE